jgi:hypothetical protein
VATPASKTCSLVAHSTIALFMSVRHEAKEDTDDLNVILVRVEPDREGDREQCRGMDRRSAKAERS